MLSVISKVFGLAGTSMIILAIVLTALRYTGRRGERYSLLNHFISELGEVGISPAAWVFNLGLIIGGILLLPFMIGLGIAFQNLWGWGGVLAGVISSLGVAAVGLYPMNNLITHVRAALTYFRAGLVMVIFFAVAIFFQPSPVLPPAANLLSLAAALSYGSFLFLLGTSPKKGEHNIRDILNPQAVADRPRVWPIAWLEWVVFFSTVAWIFGIAVLG
jgi:hypothetical membrane protein